MVIHQDKIVETTGGGPRLSSMEAVNARKFLEDIPGLNSEENIPGFADKREKVKTLLANLDDTSVIEIYNNLSKFVVSQIIIESEKTS